MTYYKLCNKRQYCITFNYKVMSKITISAILTLIRLAIVLLGKGSRLIYSVIDLCDDGIINQSVEKPAWYEHVTRVIMLLEDATSSLSNLEDSLTING